MAEELRILVVDESFRGGSLGQTGTGAAAGAGAAAGSSRTAGGAAGAAAAGAVAARAVAAAPAQRAAEAAAPIVAGGIRQMPVVTSDVVGRRTTLAGVGATAAAGATLGRFGVTSPGVGASARAGATLGRFGAGASAAGAAGAAGLLGGPIGIALAGLATGAGVAAVAVTKFAQTVESQTSRLAQFSGPLAQAQAETDVRRQLALLRRAQRIGPGLARAEEFRAKFEERITDIGTEILDRLLRIFTWLDDNVAGVAGGAEGFFAFIADNEKGIRKALEQAGVAGVILGELLDVAVAATRDAANREDPRDPFTQRFLDMLPKQGRDGEALFWPPGVFGVPQPGVE